MKARSGARQCGLAIGLTVLACASPSPAQSPGSSPAIVSFDAIHQDPGKYNGQLVTVSGQVQEVLGPRMFTADEDEWVDFDGETLVIVPAPLTAAVTEDAFVTIAGRVRVALSAGAEREWGAIDLNPTDVEGLRNRVVIVAESIMREDRVQLAIRPVRASADDGKTLTDLQALARSQDERLVGRPVRFEDARVSAANANGALWVSSGDERLYVLPATAAAVRPGQTITIRGVVLELPHSMKRRMDLPPTAAPQRIYVFANEMSTHRPQNP